MNNRTLMANSAHSTVTPGPVTAERVCPATPLQLGMLFHAQSEKHTGVDIEQIEFDLPEALRIPAFIQAWQHVIDRHAILRARFEWRGMDEPQLVIANTIDLPVQIIDLSSQSEQEQAQSLVDLRDADRRQDFVMNVAPLMRLQIITRGVERFTGLWTFHHALLDGRSFPHVLSEVFALYDGESLPQQSGSRPFEDYARHLKELPLDEHKRYWSERLKTLEGASIVRMPDDENKEQSGGGALESKLSIAQTNQLRELAVRCDVTLNTVIQAAWTLVVAHWCQKPEAVFGVTRACRHAIEGIGDSIGLFINTVPMRISLSESLSLEALLKQVRTEQLALRGFETTPLNLIQRWSPTPSEAALFNSIVMYDEATLNTRMAQRIGADSSRAFVYTGQTNFALTLLVYGESGLQIRLEYAKAQFSAATAQRLLDQVRRLLTVFVEDPAVPALQLPYLSENETATLAHWNSTYQDYDLETTLADLFERQVALTPDAIALVYEKHELTYQDFNHRVNQLAHRLIALGVGPDRIVGVYAERSIEMLIAIHGAIKAGGAYVPLDPEHPEERLRFMLDDTDAAVVLTQAHLADRLPTDRTIVVIDDSASGLNQESTANPLLVRSCRHLAYVLYTSGSTGRPKGVMNEHRGIVNRLEWMQQAFALTEQDVVLQKTPTSFDVSVWELFWPLLQGARLVIAAPEGHRDTRYLSDTIQQHRVTTLHFVPSMLQLFLEEPTAPGCTSVRRVVCSGEALPRDLQDRFFNRLPMAELHNLYGPTEAAIDVSWWACDPKSPLAIVPIGRSIANTSLHVLDRWLQPVPPGVPGELHIGGVQVARGYLNRAELTAQRFVADPFSSEPNALLYKTGDKARFLPDGNLEYLGRLDFQVKIRGFRIELGEIESVLSESETVRETVVIAREDRAGDKRLVAYIVAEAGQPSDPAQLKQFVSQRLATYMVPSAFVVLDQLPLSVNGKVDRSALPAPEMPGQSDSVAPRHEIEKTIAAVWGEVLGLGSVGVTETFFDLGGDSLLLLRLANGLSSALGQEVAISDLLRLPTIEQQATLFAPGKQREDASLGTASNLAMQQRQALARRRRRIPGGR